VILGRPRARRSLSTLLRPRRDPPSAITESDIRGTGTVLGRLASYPRTAPAVTGPSAPAIPDMRGTAVGTRAYRVVPGTLPRPSVAARLERSGRLRLPAPAGSPGSRLNGRLPCQREPTPSPSRPRGRRTH